jgi:YegS/Rv2252/BmrU family lipid kinase
MSARRRATVLGRSRRGRPIEEAVRDVARALRGAGWSVATDIVAGKADLRRRARRAAKRAVDLVVVVGGDGAVGQVATRLTGTGIPLGVVPTGTGNLLATNLGIPVDRKEAIATILHGGVRTLDVGRLRIGGKRRVFTIACGIGFDADVMDETSREEKLRWGQLAYIANAVTQTGGLRNVPHVLTLDGEAMELEAAQVFVANLGRMLPLIEPRPPVRPDDGLLDVIVISASGPVPALLAGWEAIRQDGLGRSDGGHVFRARARTVRVDTDPDRTVEADGSVVGRTPLRARVVPGGLSVVVPAS